MITKPFLKWVGGKTQIINRIIESFPETISSYHEPFVGGGSVLFALLSYKKEGLIKVENDIYAYDLNSALIQVYKHVQKCPEKVYDTVLKITEEFTTCSGDEVNRAPTTKAEAHTSKESFYYWCRKRYNQLSNHTIERTALFIFLNKTCFRGVFREGPNGFNVPFGHYKKVPAVVDKEHLLEVSKLIKDVKFICQDFKELAINDNDDFVYLDPPYAPETNTSFVKYTKDGFGIEQHQSLFNICKDFKCKFVMSNANVSIVKDNFPETIYSVEPVTCRRAIHSKKPQTTTTEVMIKLKDI